MDATGSNHGITKKQQIFNFWAVLLLFFRNMKSNKDVPPKSCRFLSNPVLMIALASSGGADAATVCSSSTDDDTTTVLI